MTTENPELSQFCYVTYIKTTPERLWSALTVTLLSIEVALAAMHRAVGDLSVVIMIAMSASVEIIKNPV